MISFNLLEKDYSEDVILPDVDFKVQRYSRHAYGGPRAAVIDVEGPDDQLWQLLRLLRAPAEIYDHVGDRVWWGYLNEAELTVQNPDADRQARSVRVGNSLDTMFNRWAIMYTQIDTSTGMQTQAATSWADGTVSQNEFGIKEMLESRGAATQTHAEAARDRGLTQSQYPATTVELLDGIEPSRGSLRCRGWWDTLAWRYYSNPSQSAVDTAEQVFDIITAKGQFFDTIYQDVSSGITISEEREEVATAMAFVMELLETGTTNFRRMLANVDPNRNVVIYEEPLFTNTGLTYLKADGTLLSPFSEIIRPETCPVAFWMQQGDLLPLSITADSLSNPQIQFIEEMEYDVENDKLTPISRDQPDPWEFPLVAQG